MATDTVTWEGADALRDTIVPIDSLEPFPGNPRLGDVEAIRASIRRFGQVKPVVVDGSRIVAGHHFVRAAQAEGYTHVAVLQNEFGSEDEQRAYLLADNRTADLGPGYDIELLVEQLQSLHEIDGLDGTGYTADDLDDALARLHATPAPGEDYAPDGAYREPGSTDVREVVLMFSKKQFGEFETLLKVVSAETGAAGTSEACFRAVEIAARHLNQGG